MPTSAVALAILRDGSIGECRPIMAGYNSTFLIEICHDDGQSLFGVYKPVRGETPLWDFPHETLYKRECLAYEVSRALGWDIVPITITREGPYGVGSVQRFVHAQRGRHYFNLVEEHQPAMMLVAIFDCLINNVDRKGGHVLIDHEGRLWGIDHGLSFLAEHKMRTVMWDLEEKPMPQEATSALARLPSDARLRAALDADLTLGEVEAFYERANHLAGCATLPMQFYADAWRPYPWPAI